MQVFLISGIPGAGKTTLLKRFLGTPEGQGTAVVVNEFGATGIDDALVRSSADETVLLGNGCMCCITRRICSRRCGEWWWNANAGNCQTSAAS